MQHVESLINVTAKLQNYILNKINDLPILHVA